MALSKNYYPNPKNPKKFINIEYGKRIFHNYYLIPTIVVSSKRRVSWDIEGYFVVFTFLNFYLQFNINQIVKDTSLEIFRKDMEKLIVTLKACSFEITNLNMLIDYLNENPFLITLIKNSNPLHTYHIEVVKHFLQNQVFVKQH